MKKLFFVFSLVTLICITIGYPQPNGNIPLLYQSKFTRFYGSADVWGFQLNSINYALTTIDGGLSIVNTQNPSSSFEVAHINHSNYLSQGVRLKVVDVETFFKNGIMYAYLATSDPAISNNPLVIIINLNASINQGGLILIDPGNGTPNPNSPFAGKINDLNNVSESHTLTIAGNYLFVASRNPSYPVIPIWNLSTPTNPTYISEINLTTPRTSIHEMYTKPTTCSQGYTGAKIYAACLEGGLQVIDVCFIPFKNTFTAQVNNITVHLYDWDRAYPNQRQSSDPLFDSRFTHSAWPTDDGAYVFTTDELAVWPPDYPHQYSGQDENLYGNNGILQTPRREGANLRTWQTSTLGTDQSFKGGFYVSEESPWGITDLTQIDTNWIPNSIHQMFVRGSYLFVSHYSQGFRMLDISNPENIIELGWYDDYPQISFNPSSNYFFRSWYYVPGSTPPARETYDWAAGIYGIFPDPNRSNICYAGGVGGFYIFDVTPPPYPPTNLTVTSSLGNHPYLQWGFNGDENNIDHYNIYKKSTYEGFQLIAETQNKFHEDMNESICNPPPGQQCEAGHWVYYYVTAVTVSDFESNASNRVGIVVNGGMPDKISVEPPIVEQPINYSLSQN